MSTHTRHFGCIERYTVSFSTLLILNKRNNLGVITDLIRKSTKETTIKLILLPGLTHRNPGNTLFRTPKSLIVHERGN